MNDGQKLIGVSDVRPDYPCPCGITPCPTPFQCSGQALKVEKAKAAAFDPSLAEAKKAMPVATGVLDYFPAALLEISKVSKAGNDKHNPGQPLHHARGKSMNHADSMIRHFIERGGIDEETGMRHSAEMAWRALALLQQELEDAGLASLPRGAQLPEGTEEMS